MGVGESYTKSSNFMVIASRTAELSNIHWQCLCELCLAPWCWRVMVQSFSSMNIYSFTQDFKLPFWWCCLFQSCSKIFKNILILKKISVTLARGRDPGLCFAMKAAGLGTEDLMQAEVQHPFMCSYSHGESLSSSSGKVSTRPSRASHPAQDANPQEAPG